MREITCDDGMRWRVEAMATPADAETEDDADAPRVALLSCTTCEGEPRHVTIRAPREEWSDLSAADLCRLIADAETAEA